METYLFIDILILQDGNFGSTDLWNEPTTPIFNTVMDFGISGRTEKDRIGMASNYIEHTPTSQVNKIVSQRFSDLGGMLTSVGLEKYIRECRIAMTII